MNVTTFSEGNGKSIVTNYDEGNFRLQVKTVWCGYASSRQYRSSLYEFRTETNAEGYTYEYPLNYGKGIELVTPAPRRNQNKMEAHHAQAVELAQQMIKEVA